MCGLAGFLGAGDRDDLVAMTRALAHRGPDGEGLYLDPDAAVRLGHRRLSIIDIADGAQPMASADGDIVVVYNGEIYNHLELRRQLERRGHVFRTDHSDTEVLVHGWREWGEELPLRLNGMFAFAVWDRRRHCLFMARDRFGEKPLYWAEQGGTLFFASELSALARHRAFHAEIAPAAVCKLLAHGFIPAPNAYWRDVRKLPGGGWLRYDLAERRVSLGRYWTFALAPEPDMDEAVATETLRGLLEQAVARRLMSDVPIGVFLSGGIDSSMVAAFAARQRRGAGIDAFAIGFAEASFDELPHARAAAAALGLRLHAETLTLQNAGALIPEILGRLDEPMADPSLLPTFLLCRFARRHTSVALSGDGGDELFAGYDTFAALRLARLYQRVIGRGGLHRGLRRLADLLPKSAANMSFDYKLRRALGGLEHGPELWHPAWLAPLDAAQIAELMETRVDPEELYAEALAVWRGSPGASDVDRGLEYYTQLYLQDDILTKVDRAAMMHGLETRAVFLDNDLVDFARRLPASLKFRNGERKYLLKRALRGILPDAILQRRKKGFGVPLMAWLKELDIPPVALPQGRGEDMVRRWSEAHRSGRADHRLALWTWMVMAHHRIPGGAAARP
ncbi:asparagine synthase (glutamine-hydrolyzing) [Ferrovibrio sp.]|uniref:asparagine synthase (glutamine-hydrolyzing) n=1 Tax=Ferrovibrio sp. TaxID=1917215 RepID=UPI0035B06023